LNQFHFHTPSEEHVNGKAFPLVAHLVHSDANGHLAVVAILFTMGAANPLIGTLWQNIPAEKGKVESVPAVSINAEGLLPADRGYVTYPGSLTTPPCSEGVTWYVLQSHPTISTAQLAAFRKIYPMNARPIQPTNNRKILQSR
jgi:carbonic anhydrase